MLNLKKFNKTTLWIIGILVLIVFSSGCTSNTNNTNSSNSQSTSNQANNAPTDSGNAVMKISYSGTWTGSIASSSGSKSVQGTGMQTFQLGPNSGSYSGSFQKTDNGTLPLTVEILDGGGNAVESETTTANYGVVTVSHTF